MINFTKDLFIGLCSQAHSYVEETHKKLSPGIVFSHRLKELNEVYINVLKLESELTRIEFNSTNNEKINFIKQKIVDLKLLINKLECSIDT